MVTTCKDCTHAPDETLLRQLWLDPEITLPEISARTGLPSADLRDRARTLGLPGRRPARTLTAFGRTLTISQWLREPECQVPYYTHITERLALGWEPERAINMPPRRDRGLWRPRKLFAAFGESRPVAAWAADSRCVVGLSTLRSRLRMGWRLEKAMMTRPHTGHLSVEVRESLRPGPPPPDTSAGADTPEDPSRPTRSS